MLKESTVLRNFLTLKREKGILKFTSELFLNER
jgi:hypothetical protein